MPYHDPQSALLRMWTTPTGAVRSQNSRPPFWSSNVQRTSYSAKCCTPCTSRRRQHNFIRTVEKELLNELNELNEFFWRWGVKHNSHRWRRRDNNTRFCLVVISVNGSLDTTAFGRISIVFSFVGNQLKIEC